MVAVGGWFDGVEGHEIELRVARARLGPLIARDFLLVHDAGANTRMDTTALSLCPDAYGNEILHTFPSEARTAAFAEHVAVVAVHAHINNGHIGGGREGESASEGTSSVRPAKADSSVAVDELPAPLDRVRRFLRAHFAAGTPRRVI